MRTYLTSCLTATLLVCSVPAHSAEIDTQLLIQLQETILQQQQQLELQSEQIQQLQKQVSGMLQHQQSAPPAPPPLAAARPTPSVPVQAASAVVSSGNDKVKLSLSGQINRALNVVSDGGSTKLYHVDNNVSNSRFRLVGTAKLTDDLTLGTRLDMTFTADESSKVSQKDQTPGNYLNARGAEVSLTSKTFGKISLGKGNTASYFTAASDLSKTDIVLYSSVADIAGGILFRRKDGQLSNTSLADVFNDFDGLSVKSRLRYDSPNLYGFSLAGSLVSNQRSDFGLNWGGEGYGFKGAAGFGLVNPKIEGSGLQYDGSFALLHSASGLNLTISGGAVEKKAARNAFSFYSKLGWLAQLTDQGTTAFGVDFSRAENNSEPGDRGTSVGAAVVQEFKAAATELYLQYRVYSLRMGDGTPTNDVNVGTFGARVKF